MEIELRFFANFREAVGTKTLDREIDEGARVGDVLEELNAEFPDLDLFDPDGDLREYLNVLRNGRSIHQMNGLDTRLEDGDALSVFPPVAGG